MDMFVLAAISRGGLNTLYALQQEAGLQPGGILPVIRRLEEEGLLNRLEEGKRRRRMMKVTAKGEAFLGSAWRNSIDTHREMESILRSVTVALLMDGPGIARSFLDSAAMVRELRTGKSAATVNSPAAAPIQFHAEMREVFESRRRAMEATVLREFAEFLEEADRKRKEKIEH